MPNIDDPKASILQAIRRMRQDREWRRFWPQQFVEAGLGTRVDVLNALNDLSRDGYVRPYFTITVDDHELWQGDAEFLPSPQVLAERARGYEEPYRIDIHFRISPAYDEIFTEKKKTTVV